MMPSPWAFAPRKEMIWHSVSWIEINDFMNSRATHSMNWIAFSLNAPQCKSCPQDNSWALAQFMPPSAIHCERCWHSAYSQWKCHSLLWGLLHIIKRSESVSLLTSERAQIAPRWLVLWRAKCFAPSGTLAPQRSITCVTAPTSLPSCMRGLPDTSVVK